MMSHTRYDNAIKRRVAERYRNRGYDVIYQPQPGDIPFDLGDFQPDLLVTGSEDEHYVVSVRTTTAAYSAEQYLEASEIVSRHPGWRFLLVTEEGPLAGLAEAGEPRSLSWPQIETGIARAASLRAQGDHEASFLALWASLEAALRNRAQEVNLPLELLQTSSVLNHMYSLGELSMDQYDAAIALLRTRDLLVHGFEAEDVAEAVDGLDALVRELKSLWAPGTMTSQGT